MVVQWYEIWIRGCKLLPHGKCSSSSSVWSQVCKAPHPGPSTPVRPTHRYHDADNDKPLQLTLCRVRLRVYLLIALLQQWNYNSMLQFWLDEEYFRNTWIYFRCFKLIKIYLLNVIILSHYSNYNWLLKFQK